MAKSLIELTTLIEQPTISIDGGQYKILHPDQLSVIDSQRFQIMASGIQKIMKAPDIDEAGAIEISSMIIDLTDRIMTGVPADLRKKLTESQRLAVAEVFMTLPRDQTRAKRKRAAPKKAPSRSAGSKRRSAANGSTAATPSAG